MTRKAIPESEKRKTLAFTMQVKDIERIEKIIDEFNKKVKFPVLTKQNFLETMIQDKLLELELEKSRSK